MAVIRNTDVEFKKGFNVFTGETGAGKSIVIDSINLLTGSRGDRELIRTGEDRAEVTALFSDLCANTVKALSEYGVEPDTNGELLITRILSSDGKGSVRINGRPSSLSVLKEAAKYLINIHGQNDNKALLDDRMHIKLLDLYAENGELLDRYSEKYKLLLSINSAIKDLTFSEREKESKIEVLEYQIKEIDSAKLREGEEEELEARVSVLRNSEKISRQARSVYRALCSNEKGVTASSLAERAADALQTVSDFLPEASGYAEKLRNYAAEMEEIAISVKEAAGIGDLDPAIELDEKLTRLDLIKRIRKKYGDTVGKALEFRKNAGIELENIKRNSELLEEKKREYLRTAKEAKALAKELSEKRAEAAKRMEKDVCSYLEFLDMPSVVFKVGIEGPSEKFNPDGLDRISFLLSANKGEELRPLSKIASGGELSRIMLAFKSALRDKDGTETVIFDEIDTGISGRTSSRIGRLLRLSSRGCQVICVTHSAQIAATSDHHFIIEKKTVNDRTESGVRALGTDERIREIARIMGGTEMTGTLLSGAKELFESSQKTDI